MKTIFLVAVAAFAVVVVAGKDCGNCPSEEGKCGCCVYPCCCKCVETEVDCPTEPPPSECPCVDLGFIIDASGSIGSDDWTLGLDFVQSVVNNIESNYGDDCGDVVNVGVVTFGNNATLNIPLTPSSDADIMGVPQARKLTNIVEGIELALETIFNVESECLKFAVIITDGRSNFRKAEIPAFGEQLQNAVDDLVCIGITSQIDPEQLGMICPADRQMSVLGFDALVDLVVSLLNQVVADMGSPAVAPVECDVTEECFCCCPPPSLKSMFYNNF